MRKKVWVDPNLRAVQKHNRSNRLQPEIEAALQRRTKSIQQNNLKSKLPKK
jgi:hypothetical protein